MALDGDEARVLIAGQGLFREDGHGSRLFSSAELADDAVVEGGTIGTRGDEAGRLDLVARLKHQALGGAHEYAVGLILDEDAAPVLLQRHRPGDLDAPRVPACEREAPQAVDRMRLGRERIWRGGLLHHNLPPAGHPELRADELAALVRQCGDDTSHADERVDEHREVAPVLPILEVDLDLLALHLEHDLEQVVDDGRSTHDATHLDPEGVVLRRGDLLERHHVRRRQADDAEEMELGLGDGGLEVAGCRLAHDLDERARPQRGLGLPVVEVDEDGVPLVLHEEHFPLVVVVGHHGFEAHRTARGRLLGREGSHLFDAGKRRCRFLLGTDDGSGRLGIRGGRQDESAREPEDYGQCGNAAHSTSQSTSSRLPWNLTTGLRPRAWEVEQARAF
jgi:hypothetical protein